MEILLRKYKKILLAGFVFFLVVGIAGTAMALSTWDEFFDGGFDAGELFGTAQIPSPPLGGGSTLDEITGSIFVPPIGSFSTDVDMYRIYIPIPSAFSASAVFSTSIDPQLFLFDDLTGLGVYANNNALLPLSSFLPSGHPLGPSVAGFYNLAISTDSRDPISLGGGIFPSLSLPGAVVGPTGPGGSETISDWSGPGSSVDGDYAIHLTGAAFVSSAPLPVPEPSTFLMVGTLLLWLVVTRSPKGCQII